MNFGAEVFEQGSGEGSGEGLGGFKSSQVIQVVKLNRVADKVPEKVLEEIPAGFGAARSCSTGFRRRSPEKVWEVLVQSQVIFNFNFAVSEYQ